MADVPVPDQVTEWTALIDAWPVHSARRSFSNFKRHLDDQLSRLPDLTLFEPGFMLHAQHVEVEPKAFLHYAAESTMRFGEGIQAYWPEFLRRLRHRGVNLAEVWAGGLVEAEIFERLGFKLGDEMAWYRFDAPQPGPVDTRIRTYRPTDFEALMAIHHATAQEAWWLGREAYEDWLKIVATRVLEVGDTIAGYSHVRQIEQQGLFEGLAVHPHFQRRGIATALIRDTFNWFATRAAESIDLYVLETNDAGIKLYEGLNFERMGRHIQLTLAF